MLPNLATEIAALPRLRVSELRIKFAEVCGEPTPSHNQDLAGQTYCLALASPGRRRLVRTGPQARCRADCRCRYAPVGPACRCRYCNARTARDPARSWRRPLAAAELTRRYKGRTLQVEVLEHGFAFEGKTYRSLSRISIRSMPNGKLPKHTSTARPMLVGRRFLPATTTAAIAAATSTARHPNVSWRL